MKIIQNDIELNEIVLQWRAENFKIVFTNGCFDLFHRGHAEYLNKARNLGNRLIVGLNTDQSVKRLKGQNRPFINQNDRAYILSGLRYVDAVVFFKEDTPLKLIKKVKPDILVKGSDYRKEEIVGADFVEKNGGKVKTIKLVEGRSTSNLIKKIRGEL